VELIGRTMEWFAANGMPKERLGAALDRLGLDEFLKAVL
jgi:dissimilatory sulfite reductase (desulfoviridin) alpha/beta subunit